MVWLWQWWSGAGSNRRPSAFQKAWLVQVSPPPSDPVHPSTVLRCRIEPHLDHGGDATRRRRPASTPRLASEGPRSARRATPRGAVGQLRSPGILARALRRVGTTALHKQMAQPTERGQQNQPEAAEKRFACDRLIPFSLDPPSASVPTQLIQQLHRSHYLLVLTGFRVVWPVES